MRTSVDIPDALLRRARKLARERKTTLRALIVDGLGRALSGETHRARYRMKDCSFRGDGLCDGLEWGEWDALRDRIYEGRGG